MRPVPHQQIVAGSSATLSWQYVDGDGEPADPADTVTLSIATAAGVDLGSGTATGTGADARTYSMAAPSTLELLTVTWSVDGTPKATTLVEVVGGFYFTTTAVRERDAAMADRTKYPPERIIAVRAEVEALIEEVTNQSWVPRYRRESIAGSGHNVLVCDETALRRVRSVRALSSDGVTYTEYDADQLAELTATEWGTIEKPPGGCWAKGTHYVVEYEHGRDRPTPDLRDAAITLLRARLNSHRSGIPDRATSMSTDTGQTYSLATPGTRGFITGIPDVDETLRRYSLRAAGIA